MEKVLERCDVADLKMEEAFHKASNRGSLQSWKRQKMNSSLEPVERNAVLLAEVYPRDMCVELLRTIR